MSVLGWSRHQGMVERARVSLADGWDSYKEEFKLGSPRHSVLTFKRWYNGGDEWLSQVILFQSGLVALYIHAQISWDLPNHSLGDFPLIRSFVWISHFLYDSFLILCVLMLWWRTSPVVFLKKRGCDLDFLEDLKVSFCPSIWLIVGLNIEFRVYNHCKSIVSPHLHAAGQWQKSCLLGCCMRSLKLFFILMWHLFFLKAYRIFSLFPLWLSFTVMCLDVCLFHPFLLGT